MTKHYDISHDMSGDKSGEENPMHKDERTIVESCS